jgi:FAD/FMN-containing dehydrogenase/pimeloyl-ACP methyl ester carboxylesterase
MTTHAYRDMTDSGGNYRARQARVEQPQDEQALRAILDDARRNGLRVVIRGAGWCQGGLTLCQDAIQIDTSSLNRIIHIDREQRTARVQAGVTWDQLREALNPLGLSTRSNQSYGVFSIGGSVSVNAHGRNIDTGVLAATVASMRVMLADGSVAEASRMQHAELFGLVLGGLGLFGIVVDVTLHLALNERYTKSAVTVMATSEYPRHFLTRVRPDGDIHFHYARLNVDEDRVWQRLYCLDYRVEADDGRALSADALQEPEATRSQRMMLWAMRRFRWARRLRFAGDVLLRMRPEQTRRNNVARESINVIRQAAAANAKRVYWLQEFFIPVPHFSRFIEQGRKVLQEEDFRLLNTTIRYVPANEDAFLSYAREDCFSLVIFFEQALRPDAISRTEAVLRRLLDCALACGGSYYLCYQRFASPQQLRQAYPKFDEFFSQKRRHDPQEMFSNQFYAHYAQGGTAAHPCAAEPKRRPGKAILYDRDNPPQPMRTLRLPDPERYSIVTGDGVELRLERYRTGSGTPLILAAGYSMPSRVFTLDTIDTSLAEYLAGRGHDIWLFSWRSSPGLPSARGTFTLDDVAHYDWPAAVNFVLEKTGADDVHCIVHCIGSQTLLMSALLGKLDGKIRSAVCLQAGLHYDVPLLTTLKSWARIAEVLTFAGVRYINPAADLRRPFTYRALDRALLLWPISARQRCNNPTCRRAAFLWGELLNHDNINDATHERMADLLGDAALHPFIQMTRNTRHRKVVDMEGRDIYFQALHRLRLPITFVHGRENATFHGGSTLRTYDLLCRENGQAWYRHHVIDGYGHMDCLIGRDAASDVFPAIAEHLARAQ